MNVFKTLILRTKLKHIYMIVFCFLKNLELKMKMKVKSVFQFNKLWWDKNFAVETTFDNVIQQVTLNIS